MYKRISTRFLTFSFVFLLLAGSLFGVQSTAGQSSKKKHRRTAHAASAVKTKALKTAGVKVIPAKFVASNSQSSRRIITSTRGNATTQSRRRRPLYNGFWTEPTYADSTLGDDVDGEDLEVRRAAVDALNGFNGSVVVVDPNTGRILTMVNQRLALGSGFIPCSTIKLTAALAALNEGLIQRTEPIRVFGRTKLTLTEALAKSNNPYFANLGIRLGYDKVSYYAHLFGYGEKAGLNIPGEHEGFFPEGPPKNGGMGMLTSFGEEIQQTPLQLAALMSAIANGGTLYYLQYPRNQEAAQQLVPRIKRRLEIQNSIPEIKPGMLGAVQFGTARRAQQDEPIAGKTGTCSQSRTHLGWFGSFNDVGDRKLVVVVLLTGGRPAIGPMASGVAGEVYRRLAQQNYITSKQASRPAIPASLISTQICCAQ